MFHRRHMHSSECCHYVCIYYLKWKQFKISYEVFYRKKSLKMYHIYIIFLYPQIFGPVQCILKFKDMNEVLERANRTQYGLAAGVITNDINKALTVSQNLDAGSVWLVDVSSKYITNFLGKILYSMCIFSMSCRNQIGFHVSTFAWKCKRF